MCKPLGPGEDASVVAALRLTALVCELCCGGEVCESICAVVETALEPVSTVASII